MNLSEENKAEVMRFIDSHLFLGCCKLVAERAAMRTDTGRPAADLGILMALEKGVNEFPSILREIIQPSRNQDGPPMPRSLHPERRTLRP